MVISTTKTKTMHIHKKVRVTVTTEAEITALKLKHICSDCKRDFTTTRGLAIHNGLNSRCLHVITGKYYRKTATNPDFNLVLAIRQRRLRYLGHILCMNSRRLVRRTLVAYIHGMGYLMEDYGEMPLEELLCLAGDRKRWNTKVNALK